MAILLLFLLVLVPSIGSRYTCIDYHGSSSGQWHSSLILRLPCESLGMGTVP